MAVDIIVQNEEKKNRLSGLSVTSADNRLEYFQSPSYYIAKKPHPFPSVLLFLCLFLSLSLSLSVLHVANALK